MVCRYSSGKHYSLPIGDVRKHTLSGGGGGGGGESGFNLVGEKYLSGKNICRGKILVGEKFSHQGKI